MVIGEGTNWQVAASDDGESRGAKDGINSSVVDSGFAAGCGEDGWVMSVEEEINQPVFVKECGDRCLSYFMVEVSHNHQSVTRVTPFGELRV